MYQSIFCVYARIKYDMLKMETRKFYQVKAGQSVYDIADAFGVSPFKISQVNHLKEPVYTGQILYIPGEKSNAYTVKEGEDKRLLCGSEEKYFQQNGTHSLYLGMKIRL